MCLVFLVVAAIAGAIAVKLSGVGGDNVDLPGVDTVCVLVHLCRDLLFRTSAAFLKI